MKIMFSACISLFFYFFLTLISFSSSSLPLETSNFPTNNEIQTEMNGNLNTFVSTLDTLAVQSFAPMDSSAVVSSPLVSSSCSSAFSSYSTAAQACIATLLPSGTTTFSLSALDYVGIAAKLDSQCSSSGCLTNLKARMSELSSVCSSADYDEIKATYPNFDYKTVNSLADILCSVDTSKAGDAKYCFLQLKSSKTSLNAAIADLQSNGISSTGVNAFLQSSSNFYETICTTCFYRLNTLITNYGIASLTNWNEKFGNLYCLRDNNNQLCIPQIVQLKTNTATTLLDTNFVCGFCFQRVLGAGAGLAAPALLSKIVDSTSRKAVNKYCSSRRSDGTSCFVGVEEDSSITSLISKYAGCVTSATYNSAINKDECPTSCTNVLTELTNFGCCLPSLSPSFGLESVFNFLGSSCKIPTATCPVQEELSITLHLSNAAKDFALGVNNIANKVDFTEAATKDLAMNLALEQALNRIQWLQTYEKPGLNGVYLDFRVNVTHDQEAKLLKDRITTLFGKPSQTKSGHVDLGAYLNSYVAADLPSIARSSPTQPQSNPDSAARISNEVSKATSTQYFNSYLFVSIAFIALVLLFL